MFKQVSVRDKPVTLISRATIPSHTQECAGFIDRFTGFIESDIAVIIVTFLNRREETYYIVANHPLDGRSIQDLSKKRAVCVFPIPTCYSQLM